MEITGPSNNFSQQILQNQTLVVNLENQTGGHIEELVEELALIHIGANRNENENNSLYLCLSLSCSCICITSALALSFYSFWKAIG